AGYQQRCWPFRSRLAYFLRFPVQDPSPGRRSAVRTSAPHGGAVRRPLDDHSHHLDVALRIPPLDEATSYGGAIHGDFAGHTRRHHGALLSSAFSFFGPRGPGTDLFLHGRRHGFIHWTQIYRGSTSSRTRNSPSHFGHADFAFHFCPL